MIDYRTMPKSEKYSMFNCSQRFDCPNAIQDVLDGEFYCQNPECHFYGDCGSCDHYIFEMSWCERCCYDDDIS